MVVMMGWWQGRVVRSMGWGRGRSGVGGWGGHRNGISPIVTSIPHHIGEIGGKKRCETPLLLLLLFSLFFGRGIFDNFL